MTKTTVDNFDERRDAIAELATACEQITDAISCADCCETPSDFDANLDDAIAAAEAFLAAVRAVRS